MKYIVLFTLGLFLIACHNEQPCENLDFEELRNNSIDELYLNYKHYPGNLMKERKLFEDFFYEAKSVHEIQGKKNLENLKSKALFIYSTLRIENELVIKELNDLNSDSFTQNKLYFIEYLISNDFYKAMWQNAYKFDNMEIGFSHQQINDSIEINIFPKGTIKWYNPLIIINNDTIMPSNLDEGTGTFKIANKTKKVTLKGEYIMRHNFDKLHFEIDTTIKITN